MTRTLRTMPHVLDLDRYDLDQLRRRRGVKWTRFGPDVLPAWVADMDFPVAEPIRRALQETVAASDLGYPEHPDDGVVPRLFAERMGERYGWQVDPGLVTVLSDVVQGIQLAVGAYSQPGDGVVIQTPVYPPFFAVIEAGGRRLVENPLVRTDERYELDLDGLRGCVRDEDVRVLLLCNPHNPTGRVLERHELQAIADVALEHDLHIVSDEIHGDLVYPGPGPTDRHVPIASLSPEVAERTITLTSVSKAFNVAGLRCAVAAFGSEEARKRFEWLPPHVRGGVNALGIAATEAAWTSAQPWLDEVLVYLDANRRYVAEFFAAHLPQVVHITPEATYLAWLDCRPLRLDRSPCEVLLERGRVGVGDGADFGTEGIGFVRLNFATPRPLLAQVLERVAEGLVPTAGR